MYVPIAVPLHCYHSSGTYINIGMPLTKLSLKLERSASFVYHKYFVNGVARARALDPQQKSGAGAPAGHTIAANCAYRSTFRYLCGTTR